MQQLAKALVAAQPDIKPVLFDSKSTAYGGKEYRYASIAAVMDSVRLPLAKHGLVVMQLVSNDGTDLVVTTRLLHASGEFVEASQRAQCPLKPQDRGGVTTYLRRYGLNGILGLAAEEDDDADGAQRAHEEPRKRQEASVAPSRPAVQNSRERVEKALAGKVAPSGDGVMVHVGRPERIYVNDAPKPHRIILEDGTEFKAWQNSKRDVEALQKGEEYRFTVERKPGRNGYPDEWFMKNYEVNKSAEVPAGDEVPF